MRILMERLSNSSLGSSKTNTLFCHISLNYTFCREKVPEPTVFSKTPLLYSNCFSKEEIYGKVSFYLDADILVIPA